MSGDTFRHAVGLPLLLSLQFLSGCWKCDTQFVIPEEAIVACAGDTAWPYPRNQYLECGEAVPFFCDPPEACRYPAAEDCAYCMEYTTVKKWADETCPACWVDLAPSSMAMVGGTPLTLHCP